MVCNIMYDILNNFKCKHTYIGNNVLVIVQRICCRIARQCNKVITRATTDGSLAWCAVLAQPIKVRTLCDALVKVCDFLGGFDSAPPEPNASQIINQRLLQLL
jgi:hypothetical protein